MMEKTEKKMQHLEDLIDELGGVGRFQYILFFGVYTIFCVSGWSTMQMMYSGMIPPWRCQISEPHRNDTYTHSGDSRSSASTFNVTTVGLSPIVAENNDTLNVCSINGTTCETFVFLTSSRTIINEWNIICDLKWIKQITLSVQMCGILLGAAVCGQLGDLYGRKKILYSFELLHLIVNIIAGLSANWIMYMICLFLIGIATGAINVVAFIYVLELFPIKSRSVLGLTPMFAVGMCIFSGFAVLLDNWSYLHFACAVFNLPFILGSFYFPDSIRWLAVHGGMEKAMDAIRKIARCNRKSMPSGTTALLQKIAQEEREIRQSGKAYSYLDIFRDSAVRKVVLIDSFFWFSLTVVVFGISFGVSSLDGNIFLNSFLIPAIIVTVSIVMIFIADLLKRRHWSWILSFAAATTSAACVIVLAVPAIGNKGEIINGLSLTINMLSYPLWNILGLWGTELLPTVVRNLGYGFITMGSRLAGIVLPFIMNFDDNIIVPYIVTAILLTICFLLCFFLPETRGRALSDSFTRTVVVETGKGSYSVVKDIDQVNSDETALT